MFRLLLRNSASGRASLLPRPASAAPGLFSRTPVCGAAPTAMSLLSPCFSVGGVGRRDYSVTAGVGLPSPKKGALFEPGVYPLRGKKKPRKRHQKRYKMRARQTILNNKLSKAQVTEASRKRDAARVARWRKAGALLKAREAAINAAREAAGQ